MDGDLSWKTGYDEYVCCGERYSDSSRDQYPDTSGRYQRGVRIMIKTVSASVFFTPKFIYIRAEDYYHEIIPSIKGLHAVVSEPASLEWLGGTLRQALRSASFIKVAPEQWNHVHFKESKDQAKARFEEELQAVADKFKLRSKESVLIQALKVWGFWRNGAPDDDLNLVATDHKRGGYAPWSNEPKNDDKRMTMDLASSDTEIGLAMRRMEGLCLLNGKRHLVP